MLKDWKKYDESIVKEHHGNIDFYRKLYEGEHSALFPRAINLIKSGEITDIVEGGNVHAKNVRVPYIVANFSKVIPEITATFVSRSIGDIKTSIQPGDFEDNVTDAADDLIDGTEDSTANGTILNLQQELISQIAKDSGLSVAEHWSNIVQQQVDGGIVGVPFKDADGIRIEFKGRDVYFPHADGKGADLVYYFTEEDENEKEVNFLHVYRERIEAGALKTKHFAYTVGNDGRLKEITEPADIRAALGFAAEDAIEDLFPNRSSLSIKYWANDKTFMNPLGVSVLKGIEGKQDEINWTMTRNAIIFERNGKPRVAVSKEVMARLQAVAQDRYGDPSMIDSSAAEVVTFDEAGKALEYIQMDITKIGTVENVKQYMKMMLAETQTSERAVDFLSENGAAQSGIAKYYDLIVTLLKSERIQQEYASFLKDLFESALWLANREDSKIQIEKPEIEFREMISMSRKEVVELNVHAYEKGAQSLETTVRRINPGASEEWIEAEVERIELAKQSSDTSSLSGNAATLESLLDNPSTRAVATTPPAVAEEE